MKNQVTRLCVAVLVILNTLPCSGVTGGVQLEGGALFFNPCPIVALYCIFQSFSYSGAQTAIEALRDGYGIYSSCKLGLL